MFGLAREGITDELASFVDAGLSPDLTNEKGDTLVMLAAYQKHPDTVVMLLARGADTARVNDRGQTALGAAVFRQSGPSVEALLAAGADPALGGPSALEVAAFFELPEMTALLTTAHLEGDPAEKLGAAGGGQGDAGPGEGTGRQGDATLS